MNAIVLIESNLLSNNDVVHLNSDEITFNAVGKREFFDEATILVIFEILQNIGYNAIYDILKTAILQIFDLIGSKDIKETKLDLSYNGNSVSFECNFPLTRKQKNELVKSAIEKILDD